MFICVVRCDITKKQALFLSCSLVSIDTCHPIRALKCTFSRHFRVWFHQGSPPRDREVPFGTSNCSVWRRFWWHCAVDNGDVVGDATRLPRQARMQWYEVAQFSFVVVCASCSRTFGVFPAISICRVRWDGDDWWSNECVPLGAHVG